MNVNKTHILLGTHKPTKMCVCVCVCAYVRACVYVCVYLDCEMNLVSFIKHLSVFKDMMKPHISATV